MTTPYHHGALPAALLQAAEAILEREGIGALTMRGAAREAGVSHAAPSHHFGDLSGLLTALAASGFVRLREHVEAEVAVAEPGRSAHLTALGRGYIGFARASPALFQLMFRSERLDWSNPVLSTAGAAAFSFLTLRETEGAVPIASHGIQSLMTATARWSLMHGLAMLLIDGRLGAMSDRVPGADVDTLIEHVLTCLVRQEM
jgi:AcrR family transcriptional regulator